MSDILRLRIDDNGRSDIYRADAGKHRSGCTAIKYAIVDDKAFKVQNTKASRVLIGTP